MKLKVLVFDLIFYGSYVKELEISSVGIKKLKIHVYIYIMFYRSYIKGV